MVQYSDEVRARGGSEEVLDLSFISLLDSTQNPSFSDDIYIGELFFLAMTLRKREASLVDSKDS